MWLSTPETTYFQIKNIRDRIDFILLINHNYSVFYSTALYFCLSSVINSIEIYQPLQDYSKSIKEHKFLMIQMVYEEYFSMILKKGIVYYLSMTCKVLTSIDQKLNHSLPVSVDIYLDTVVLNAYKLFILQKCLVTCDA